MNKWQGIAIASMWIGVGMIGLNEGGAGVCASILAVFATMAVCIS